MTGTINADEQEIFWIGLFQQLHFPWSPSLVKPRLQRAIKPKNRVPTRFRNRLYPIILLASRRFRPEIDIHRTIGINQKPFSLTTDTRKLLIGLDLRSRLVAVKNTAIAIAIIHYSSNSVTFSASPISNQKNPPNTTNLGDFLLFRG